jgi:hypothetical protein
MDCKEVRSAVSKLLQNLQVRIIMDIHEKGMQVGVMVGCNEKCREKGCSLDKPKSPMFIDYLKLIAVSMRR